MVRLFVALPLPPLLRQTLALAGGGIPGARWSPPGNLHITLKFIGDVDERVADDIVSALDTLRAPAFEVAIRGVGLFESGKGPRILYAAVVPSPPLLDLEKRVEAALALVPGLDVDDRRFVPHVTLARLKAPDAGRLRAFVEGNGGLAPPPWRADRFALYSSVTGGEHPVYTPEEWFDLADENRVPT